MMHPRPFRVLVAEDDVEMRRVVADALRDDGYDVVELADGGRLLVDIAARMKAETAGESVDLIVSDIRMPICTGLQILEVLRQSHWHTPVILMTAFGDDATRKHAESLWPCSSTNHSTWTICVRPSRTCCGAIAPRPRHPFPGDQRSSLRYSVAQSTPSTCAACRLLPPTASMTRSTYRRSTSARGTSSDGSFAATSTWVTR